MAPVTRQGPSTLPNNTNPNNMTSESVQAMIDQALLRNSTNRDGSHSSHEDNQRNVQTARPCFYADFMKCQCLNFKGTEGVVGLTRWIEKVESVFQISGCAIENQVKFATCTMLDGALTWWNSQRRSLGPDAYLMTWEVLKKKMTDKYCFTLDETIELANDLMDQKLRTYAERQFNNKRKADDSFKNNHGHQQQTLKRQNVAKVYNMGTGERKLYNRNLPKCTKCHFHHNGLCTQKCHKCNKVGHFARDCRSSGNANVTNAQRNNGENPKGNGCFECGVIPREHADYINRIEILFTINSRPHHPINDNTNVESFSSLPIPIQDSDPHQEEIDVVAITNDVLPPSVENEDSDEEVDVVDVLRVDNSSSNSEHEYSESKDSDFYNPSISLPHLEPPDKEFDFEIDFKDEISVVRSVIVKFECIDAKVKFDVFNDENDVLSYFMFDKMFSFLSAESEDTIFDPGIFLLVIEVFLCWIFIPVSKIFTSFD
nr:reverse transcriptase domain-containing protein [Tanacetum cinerariifolium]